MRCASERVVGERAQVEVDLVDAAVFDRGASARRRP
jgi:hypothetical protein